MKIPHTLWLLILPALALTARAADWPPITPEELASKQAEVEPGADAEVLFWETRVKDEWQINAIRSVYDNHIRIKIFNERGRERLGTVDITYKSGVVVTFIEARTIKPDGSILEMKSDDVFEREVVKSRSLKLKSKAFALPGLEPGCIIEYRWRENRAQRDDWYKLLYCQHEYPVRRFTLIFTPYEKAQIGMSVHAHQVSNSPLERQRGDAYRTYVTNVPSFREEPYMPPENQVRAWLLLFYNEDGGKAPAEYWKKRGRKLWDNAKLALKETEELRYKANVLVTGLSSDQQKIKRIYDFCRSEIKNSDDDASFTKEEREKIKDNDSASQTLQRGVGTSEDIVALFAALARAAGMDARIAFVSDRSDIFFDSNFPADYFLSDLQVAIKIGNGWGFYNPGRPHVEYGMLPWQHEGVPVLVSDPKEPFFVQAPFARYTRNAVNRTANLRLTGEGDLEGDITMEYKGHSSAILKEEYDEESATEREQAVKDFVKKSLPAAELSDIRLENIGVRDQPFAYKFHIRVPGYAQKTGKRLFLQPAFFQKGDPPRFTASERKMPVYFSYPWMEEDRVSIELPEGYQLEAPELPPTLESGQLSRHSMKATVQGATLSFERSFHFDGIIFMQSDYPTVKSLFDSCQQRDSTLLTLKQTEAKTPVSD